MRSGVSAIQQTLTPEAASVLKHSLSLARRRGHAQLTPLHLASTLPSSLLINSHSHSHHFQCKALDLCFNVALNRLPTSPHPLLHPSLSNALIAALKRAQAHQRRGSSHLDHQQPLVSNIKVELEHLVISILDDPTVSRVMREAGFSSTAVKNNLHSNSLPFHFHRPFNTNNAAAGVIFSSPASSEDQVIKMVFEGLLRKRNTVIVGDSAAAAATAAEVTGRFERGAVPEELRRVRFFRFDKFVCSLKMMKREDVEKRFISELKSKVVGYGVIIYTGDLKWTVHDDHEGYNPVDHAVEEIASLIRSNNNNNDSRIGKSLGVVELPKVWIIGIANNETYMKCQMRKPISLPTLWSLQPLSLHAPLPPSSRLISISLSLINYFVRLILITVVFLEIFLFSLFE